MFFLVYVIGCVSLQDHVLLGPLAIGTSLMVMIFAGATSVQRNPAKRLTELSEVYKIMKIGFICPNIPGSPQSDDCAGASSPGAKP
jgi:hypothetical protein